MVEAETQDRAQGVAERLADARPGAAGASLTVGSLA